MNQSNPLSAKEARTQSNGSGTSAFRIALITAVVTIFVIPFLLFVAWQLNSWQLYVMAGVTTIPAVIYFVSLQMIRRGAQDKGAWLLLLTQLSTMLLGVLLVANVGLLMGLMAIIVTYIVAIQSMTTKSARRSMVVGVIAGLLFALIDLLKLDYRLAVPAMQVYLEASGVLFVLAVGFFIARQAWQRSIRNKLLIAFIGVTFIAAGSLAIYAFTVTTRTLRTSLELQLTEHTTQAANGIGALIDEQVDLTQALALNEILEETVEEINGTYQGDANAIQAIMELRDTEWRAADAANNDSDPLLQEYLTNPAAVELKEFQNLFPEHIELFVTDIYGGQAGTTDRTSDYYQADEAWWQAAYNKGQGAVYISEPEYDESAGALALLIAVPLRNDETGKITGILRTTFRAADLNTILGEEVGKTGVTALLIPGETASYFHGEEFRHLDPGVFKQLEAAADQGMVQMNFEGVPSVVLEAPVQSLEEDSMVESLDWFVVYHQNQQEAFGLINAQIRGALFVIAIVVILAVAAALLLSFYLVQPIAGLTQTAEEVASGNLKSRATITSTDEIGILATAFNSMTFQLQETLQGLEQRVASRTRDLEIVAEVGTATATILDYKRLLQEVVDLTKERFHLYHSHIYLLDEKGENLVLTAGAGEPGRIMVKEGRSIPLDREQSLVARAARERKGVTVNDVTQSPDFLPNPLLPETRSELAVPMIIGGMVIGVFDIQSEQVGRFTDSDVNIQTTLAAQLATSIQNVRSFQQSKKQAELETLVNAIGQKIQRSTSVEDTLQIAVREIGLALGASRVSVNIQADRQSSMESVK